MDCLKFRHCGVQQTSFPILIGVGPRRAMNRGLAIAGDMAPAIAMGDQSRSDARSKHGTRVPWTRTKQDASVAERRQDRPRQKHHDTHRPGLLAGSFKCNRASIAILQDRRRTALFPYRFRTSMMYLIKSLNSLRFFSCLARFAGINETSDSLIASMSSEWRVIGSAFTSAV